ncbi:MAG: Eco57I restriction-modification methylase domain-containing protein [Mycoplasmoidaceae bacterium]
MAKYVKKKILGQVFTPNAIVGRMINLISIKNPELVLETSSGTGNFYFLLKNIFDNVIGIEIDKKIAHQEAIIDSYFNTNFKPDVIIGNPPYVDFKDIKNKPTSHLLYHKPNLYLFFLEKALMDLKPNGELIWIIPSSIFTTSSSRKINEIIFENFSINYWEQMSENIWENASVPTSIIKIVKQRNHQEKLKYFLNNGKILFGEKPVFNEKLIAKVGGASGFNSKLLVGETPFVVSHTERTNKLNYIVYEPSKWIRPTPKPPINFKYQIFVNCKTRKNKPFYIMDNKNVFLNYDASVICIFTFCSFKKTTEILNKLNEIDWEKMGVKRDGRYHFSQSVIKSII